MPLSPELQLEFDPDEEEEIGPSRTFELNLETMEFTGRIIEGVAAIKQYIYIALRTARFAYPIHSLAFGSELGELLSDPELSIEYKKMEIPRLVTEALIYDERIQSVQDFEFVHDGDRLITGFTVDTVDGSIEIEEVFTIA